MKNNGKRIMLFVILLFSILTIFQKIYAQYIINRSFSVNVTTANFDVTVQSATIKIYHVDKNIFSVSITNNNDYSVKGNIKFRNKMITDFEIPAKTTKEITDLKLTADMISGLAAATYDLDVAITAPYTTVIKNVKISLQGTITNVEKYNVTVAGTKSDPYLIYAVEDLVRFAQKVNAGTTYSGKYIKQARNINFKTETYYYNSQDVSFGDLNGVSDGNQIMTEMTTGTGFIGIGVDEKASFKGTYLGNNKKISNLYINNSSGRTGLFVYISDGATIQDLGIAGSIKSVGDAGSLVGLATGKCTLTNCYNNAEITNSAAGYSVGGLVGTIGLKDITADVKMTGCYNTAQITNFDATAGLVGFFYSQVAGSKLTLEQCYNSGAITATRTGSSGYVQVAGLVVKDYSNANGTLIINKCYNSGNLKGYCYVGGLVSQISGTLTITDSYNSGNVTATTGNYAGGLIARKTATAVVTIKNCYSSGTVSGPSTIGGIIGYNNSGTTVGVTYSGAYYLNTNSVPNTYGGTAMTETNMKAQSFATKLGANFVYNSGGYPKLVWENVTATINEEP